MNLWFHFIRQHIKDFSLKNRIDGVMISMLASSLVDHEFEHLIWSH